MWHFFSWQTVRNIYFEKSLPASYWGEAWQIQFRRFRLLSHTKTPCLSPLDCACLTWLNHKYTGNGISAFTHLFSFTFWLWITRTALYYSWLILVFPFLIFFLPTIICCMDEHWLLITTTLKTPFRFYSYVWYPFWASPYFYKQWIIMA